MSPILLVEDNEIFRKSLREMLEYRFPEIEIEEACNGEEALRKLETLNAELIFMDIRLPGMNGLETTRKILEADSTREVVILTSHDIPEYRAAAFGSGASQFFTKGNTRSEEIAGFVEAFFQERGSARALARETCP
ncbi:MAG: response regulator transcription factor [Syntrophobacteraceae bacterium]|nr:response regulator transcription factor [Syntrophobacteraceae bacterium]